MIFAPIVTPDSIGNGTHIHFSLWNGNPAMYDTSGFCELSDVGAYFVAGILHHLPALAAITAPSVSSYFRLQPNRWAPTWANLGYLDRGASLRICPGFSASRKMPRATLTWSIELRTLQLVRTWRWVLWFMRVLTAYASK